MSSGSRFGANMAGSVQPPAISSRRRGLAQQRSQRQVDRAEHAADSRAERRDGPDANDGDETDEHAIFDESRAGLVLDQTLERTHGEDLMRVQEEARLGSACLSQKSLVCNLMKYNSKT